MWKTLLTTCGGIRELSRCKNLTRELCGLPAEQETGVAVKSSPADFIAFREETSVKYPTFTPAPGSDQPAAALSHAYSPIPIRPHYHHPDVTQGFSQDPLGGGYGFSRPPLNPNAGPLPPTPIPTPPLGSPKPKKQQYQTDQNRPFVFPFSSRSRLRNAKLVPFAIDEADRLYEHHMHVGAPLWQMAKTREEYILDESGLDNLPNKHDSLLELGGFLTGIHDKRYSVVSTVGGNDDGETLADIALLDRKIAEAEKAVRNAETSSERRKAQEKKEDLIRLGRVETIYVSCIGIPMIDLFD